MGELIRAFAKRAVELLSPNQVNSFGTLSHPENYQSAKFKEWLVLCRQNNPVLLKTEMTNYLRSDASIKKIDDLGAAWAHAIPAFFSIGKDVTKEQAYSMIKESKLETIFNADKAKYATGRMAIADTILCLSYLKNLSHKGNIDYLNIFKVMTFAERCFDYKMKLPELNVIDHFEKPILLPVCFTKTDPCDSMVGTTPFSFLDETRATGKVVNGCSSDGNCTCTVNNECVDQSKCCAKPRIDVIDLMIVKDYTKCYHAGDLSYIKNVLEGETLLSKHKRLDRTESLTETEDDLRTFEEKYLQTEDKASLQNETDNVIKQDTSFNAGLTTSSKFGMQIGLVNVDSTVGTSTNYSNTQSKTLSNKSVVDSSKDIVDRATRQVEEKVRTLMSTKRIQETREMNKSKFDNTNGPNISGQYLYVDKISRAQVYNYGKKAVIDLVLPEPASLYKRLFENKFTGVAPVVPTPIVVDPKTINPENYKTLITQYGLQDVPAPPDFFKNVTTVVQAQYDDPRFGNSGDNYKQFNVSIPPDYMGVEMYVSNPIQLDYNNNDAGVSLSVSYGGGSVFNSQEAGNSNYDTIINNTEGDGILNVRAFNVTQYAWAITIKCALKDDLKLQWQMEVIAKINAVNDAATQKYNAALADYQQAKTAFDANEADLKKARYSKDPFINRETEKAELKRMMISYISCQFYDQFDAMKNRVKPCGYPEMNIREAEEEGKFIAFFEQAFNWNLMTYIFYPYFWGRKCTWADKIREESPDPIFEKFVSAGSCRVVVPLRDGYLDYMTYFLNYGEIWGGNGNPPLPNDPHYVSLAQEIKEQDQNYYADRAGTLDVTNGTDTVTLNNTDFYWDYGTISPPTPAGLNTVNINADVNREIIIDCKVYRIVSIQPNTAVSTPTSWVITLDRNYDGATATSLLWSTGAVFVGAPWEFTTPTTLTFLRDKSACLPCYPLKECKEA